MAGRQSNQALLEPNTESFERDRYDRGDIDQSTATGQNENDRLAPVGDFDKTSYEQHLKKLKKQRDDLARVIDQLDHE